MQRRLTISVYFALALMSAFFGCNRGAKHQLTAVARFDQGTPLDAIAAFDEAAQARGAELEIIAADRAIAALMAGDPSSSEEPLRKTRNRMDFLRQKDISEQTKAVVSDDKAVAWSGREFEQRMIDNLLILCSLMGNRQDAFAYASQAMEHVQNDQELLVDNMKGTSADQPVTTVGHSEQPAAVAHAMPAARYSPNAFSAYLHAAIRSENPMDRDLTTNSIQQIGFWSSVPAATTTTASLNTESGFGTLSPRGQGVVHVITFVGRVTDWTVERSVPTTSALLIADQILSAAGDHTLPPTVAPVQIARPVAAFSPQPQVTRARVIAPQASPITISKTIVDLNKAARDSYLADRDQQIARAVARRVIKKGAVYAAKDQLAVDGGSGADLLLNLGGIAWEAIEKADTRHLQLLPARIEVLQLTLPAGEHQIALWSAPAGDSVSAPANQNAQVPVVVDNGRNTFVLCFRPHGELAGSILTSDGSYAIP